MPRRRVGSGNTLPCESPLTRRCLKDNRPLGYPGMSERRRHERASAKLALFDAGSGTFSSIEVRDVSPGGAFLVIESRPAVDSRIKLAIATQDAGARVRRLVEVHSRVKWLAHNGVGVEFDQPSSAFLEELARLFGQGP